MDRSAIVVARSKRASHPLKGHQGRYATQMKVCCPPVAPPLPFANENFGTSSLLAALGKMPENRSTYGKASTSLGNACKEIKSAGRPAELRGLSPLPIWQPN
jgi:hypothetical protein